MAQFENTTSPIVAYNANPRTGFAVYDSFAYQGQSGWLQFGGTSVGSPQWAALIAIANQGRALIGKGSLDGPRQTIPAIMGLPPRAFFDIVNGGNSVNSAGPGYDSLTGRGSPRANRVVAGLLAPGKRAAFGPSPAPSSAAILSPTIAWTNQLTFSAGTIQRHTTGSVFCRLPGAAAWQTPSATGRCWILAPARWPDRQAMR